VLKTFYPDEALIFALLLAFVSPLCICGRTTQPFGQTADGKFNRRADHHDDARFDQLEYLLSRQLTDPKISAWKPSAAINPVRVGSGRV